jgi:hypothetical protein
VAGSYTASYNGFASPYSSSDNDIFMVALKANVITVSAEVVNYPYVLADPGQMFRDAMDNYIAQGGTLTYDTASIELTGTYVTYTFNNNTILEAANQCQQLAPAGWYWYIDQATSKVHFHQRNVTADVKLTMGRDITDLQLEKRTEGIVNVVFVTGGSVNEGPNLLMRFEDSGSVATYGPWLKRYNNPNVIDATAAAAAADAILGNSAAPEIRTTVTVADSNGTGNGYDIENLHVGQTVGFRNTGNATIDALVLHLSRITYTPDAALLTLSTVPPDSSKQLDFLERSLAAIAAANNPTFAG